jgi:hypothetical protein
VEVSGGTLSSAQVMSHLQWIVPETDYQWDVQQVEENIFKVNFPSKNELVRVQHFGKFHVPDSTIILSFDFWKKEVQPVWAPEDVWVWAYGLPPVAHDDYISLWALGDVFDNLRVFISEYYKKLFGNPEPSSISLDEGRTEDIPQLSADENRALTANFSMEEVHDAIFQMKHNKSPGPDGFPAEFYQHFWGVIKYDLMALFESFQKG